MLFKIFSIVFPIFSVVFNGFTYGRKHQPSMVAANQVNMAIFVPALVFSALAGKSVDGGNTVLIAIGGAVVVLGSGLLGLPIARLFGYAPRTLLPPMMFKNAGNMGLPLLVLAFGNQILTVAVVLFLVENILHFVISSYWLGHSRKLWTVLREPVLVAGCAGALVGLLHIEVWEPVLSASRILGNVSTGLMLFSLGVRLNSAPFGQWRIGLVGAVATPLTGMCMAFLFSQIFELSQGEREALFVFGSLPPAVLNFMFAERFNQEADKVASIVIIGTLISVLSVSFALAVQMQ